MADYKTPGVYVEEISKFPPSVAGVATAIPAFIGFTAKCPKDREGNPIKQPIKVTSMVDYENKFGGAPTLQIENDLLKNNEFVMYDSMRLFYDNGGGVCYVSSIGQYNEGKDFCTEDLPKNIDTYKNAIKPLAKVDEVTLLLFPDAALILEGKELAALHQEALKHCGEMGDRFAILDVKDLEDANDKLGKTLEAFRNGVGTNNLCYGAAYYPYLKTTYPKEIKFTEMSKVSFVKDILNGVEDESDDDEQKKMRLSISTLYRENICNIDYSGVVDDVRNQLISNIKELKDFLVEIGKFGENAESQLTYAGAVVDESDLSISKEIYEYLLSHKKTSDSWLAVVDLLKKEKLGTWKDEDGVVIEDEAGDIVYSNISSLKAQKQFLNDSFKESDSNAYYEVDLDGNLNRCEKDGSEIKKTKIEAKSVGTLRLESDQADLIYRVLNQISSTTATKDGEENSNSNELYAKALIRQIDQYAVSKGKDSYSDILSDYQDQAQIITPSAAIAGIYAMVDANKGVWQAPANVSVSAVSDVMEHLSDRDQEDMNVDVNAGKSVNAIRSFSGKGIIVWGARTLDGNSNEWRYVPVRRLFNYIEESVQKSTNWAVFQPNDANTWVKVRCQIENFLSNLWRDGALAGSTPDKAFYVRVGLDETMTAQDILEGKMIVEIGLAAVRPAEFIILKFSHKLQEA